MVLGVGGRVHLKPINPINVMTVIELYEQCLS